MADTKTAAAAPTTDAAAGPASIVLDFGRKKRKQVKRLRKGKGKLVGKVEAAIQQLRASGSVAPDAQAIIIVVREKEEFGRPW